MSDSQPKLEKFTTWFNTVAIDFTYGNNDPEKMNVFNIGDDVAFRTSWMLKFSEIFPVEFYIDSCSVESSKSGQKFDIVKDGCPSPLVNAKTHRYEHMKNQIAVQYKVKYSHFKTLVINLK